MQVREIFLPSEHEEPLPAPRAHGECLLEICEMVILMWTSGLLHLNIISPLHCGTTESEGTYSNFLAQCFSPTSCVYVKCLIEAVVKVGEGMLTLLRGE